MTSLALNEVEQCLYTTCAARGELLRCSIVNGTLQTLLKVDSTISDLTFLPQVSQAHEESADDNVGNTLYLTLPQEQKILKVVDDAFTDENKTVNMKENA